MPRDFNEYEFPSERDPQGSLSQYDERFGLDEMDREFEVALKRERARIETSKRATSKLTPSTSLERTSTPPSKLGSDAIRLRFEIVRRRFLLTHWTH